MPMNHDLLRLGYYYLDLLIRRYRLGLLAASVVLLIGAIYVFNMPRNYRAEAVLAVEPQMISTALVEATVADDRMQFIEQRVFARDNLLALASRHQLFPAASATLPKTTFAELVRSQISVVGGPESSAQGFTLRIAFSYQDPQVATDVVNDVVSMIITENKRARTSRATGTVQFLQNEVSDLTKRLSRSDLDLTKFLESNRDTLPNRIPTHFAELQERGRDLADADRAINDLDDDVRLLRAQVQLSAPSLASRRTQLAAMKADLAQKSTVYSDTHPDIKALKSQIAVFEAEMSALAQQGGGEGAIDPESLSPEVALVARRISLAEPRREALVRKRDEIAQRIQWLKAAIEGAPEIEASLADIERERSGLQRSLDEMKTKLETARIGERLETEQSESQIRVLEEPEVPVYATGPTRTKLMIAVLGLAALAGLGAVYVSDLMDKRLRGAFDLEALVPGQTVVVMPYINAGDGSDRSIFGRMAFASRSSSVILLAAMAGLILADLSLRLASFSSIVA